jgi:hypothetical protein
MISKTFIVFENPENFFREIFSLFTLGGKVSHGN